MTIVTLYCFPNVSFRLFNLPWNSLINYCEHLTKISNSESFIDSNCLCFMNGVDCFYFFFLLQSHSMSLVVKITQTNRGFLVVAGMSKCSKCKSIGIRQRSNNSTEITPYFYKCLFVKPNYYLSNQFYIYPNLILVVFLIVIFFVWWNRTEIICKQWFVSHV